MLEALLGDGVPMRPKTWATSKSEDQSIDRLLQTLEVELQFNPLSPDVIANPHPNCDHPYHCCGHSL